MALNTVMPLNAKKVVPTEGGEEEPKGPMRTQLTTLVDSGKFTMLMTAVLIYALFGDDVRLAFCPLDFDNVFYFLSTIALILFTVEIVLTSIAKPKEYRFQFYFWLDVLATVSLIPDIGFIWDPMVDSLGFLSGTGTQTVLDAGKASRNGAKVGRVVRVVRLIRLVRIVKLFKNKDDTDNQVKMEPSMVGKKLSELTTRRVLVMVLGMLIILPFLDGGLDEDINDIEAIGLSQLNQYQVMLPMNETGFETVTNLYYKGSKPIYLSLCAPSCLSTCSDCNGAMVPQETFSGWVNVAHTELNAQLSAAGDSAHTKYTDITSIALELRESVEYESVVVQCHEDVPSTEQCQTIAYFAKEELVKLEALLNLAKTVSIMVLLIGVAETFTRDAQKLVINPIQRMVNVVRELAANPLTRSLNTSAKKDAGEEQGYETQLLETTLRKVGMLLSIGFGAAGAEIIGKNLNNGGKLNVLIQGKKVTGIFGFCDIRQFTDTTECLQEEVMVFVNRIGKIVHGATHQFKGAANKNIGDAFLLAWKLSANADDPKSWKNDSEVTPMINCALAAFIKIHVDTELSNKDGVLSTYGVKASIVKRFGTDYRVRMGYGLHIGWAIEGAIGTEFKIDASYLSAHVGMSGTLEESTKEYGVPLLLSGAFTSLLSPGAKKYCRKLDCVRVAGVKHDFYTFEITNIPDSFGEPGTVDCIDFQNDPNVAFLQKDIHPKFKDLFESGVDSYLKGDWTMAQKILTESLELKKNDGPSNALLRFMTKYDFKPPEDWDGSREL